MKRFLLVLLLLFLASSAHADITAPLTVCAGNARYFCDSNGKAVLFFGFHTWADGQSTDQSTSPAAFDFTEFQNALVSYGVNATVLWHKDLPKYCNWNGGTWYMTLWPWQRTGPGNATDGNPKFDFSSFNQAFFDQERARAISLGNNDIYVEVQLFDGLGVTVDRCTGPMSDGYPFSSGNNINSIADDNATSSFTMTGPNSITAVQDAYVQKMVATMNTPTCVPNVIWKPQEEGPSGIETWWVEHMISVIRAAEAGTGCVHPIVYDMWNFNFSSDATLCASTADAIAPKATYPAANACSSKVTINDSDHSYFNIITDTDPVRTQFVWKNFTAGNGAEFMDPWRIYLTVNNRNLCSTPVNGVCTGALDPQWVTTRNNFGRAAHYVRTLNDLLHMSSSASICSTGFALAKNTAPGVQILAYQATGAGGSFTCNLSASSNNFSVEWYNPLIRCRSAI